MAKLYYELIKGGNWTIERVPMKWRAEVQAMLDVDNSDMIQTEEDAG